MRKSLSPSSTSEQNMSQSVTVKEKEQGQGNNIQPTVANTGSGGDRLDTVAPIEPRFARFEAFKGAVCLDIWPTVSSDAGIAQLQDVELGSRTIKTRALLP
jgi:hypothetical protein